MLHVPSLPTHTPLETSYVQPVVLLQRDESTSVPQSSKPDPKSLEYVVKRRKKRKSSACTAIAPMPNSRRCSLVAMTLVQTVAAVRDAAGIGGRRSSGRAFRSGREAAGLNTCPSSCCGDQEHRPSEKHQANRNEAERECQARKETSATALASKNKKDYKRVEGLRLFEGQRVCSSDSS